MTVTVEIPMALPSVANLREHWAAKARRVKAQRAAVMLAMKAQRVQWQLDGEPGPWWPLHGGAVLRVTLTRVAPRALDDDNAVSAAKGVRDAVAAYFGVDDRDPRVTWRYAQSKGKACVRLSFDAPRRGGRDDERRD